MRAVSHHHKHDKLHALADVARTLKSEATPGSQTRDQYAGPVAPIAAVLKKKHVHKFKLMGLLRAHRHGALHLAGQLGGPVAAAAAVHANVDVEPAALRLLRDSDFAVEFSDRFNRNLGLPPSRMPGKLALMKHDAHTFFRAMPALFYEDILGHYAEASRLVPDKTAPTIRISGDAHMMNFATFRGKLTRAVWGINDFDLTCKGSPEWDLERLATSVMLAAKASGLKSKERQVLIDHLAWAYFKELDRIAAGKVRPEYLVASEAKSGVQALIHQQADLDRPDWMAKYLQKSSKANRSKFAQRWTPTEPHEPVFTIDNESRTRINNPREYLSIVRGIQRFSREQLDPRLAEGYQADPLDAQQDLHWRIKIPIRVLDVCEKLGSGGSSYGQPRYYALVEAADPGKPPYILEIKQELASPMADRTGRISKADSKDIVRGQREMGGCPNPLTGYATIRRQSYLVREREPQKAYLRPSTMKTVEEYKDWIDQAAKVVARSHAPSVEQAKLLQDWVGDQRVTAAQRLVDFAVRYSTQAMVDFRKFRAAHR